MGEALGRQAAAESRFSRARRPRDEVENASGDHGESQEGSGVMRILFWTKLARLDRIFPDDLGPNLGGTF